MWVEGSNSTWHNDTLQVDEVVGGAGWARLVIEETRVRTRGISWMVRIEVWWYSSSHAGRNAVEPRVCEQWMRYLDFRREVESCRLEVRPQALGEDAQCFSGK